MPKIYLICGKICCGKTTYAQILCDENNAVLLSVDEITLALFGQHCGDKHDEYVERTEKYLLKKSMEFINKDISVVLDWGFWTKEERNATKDFFKSRNIDCELHYIEVSDAVWKQQINKRNNEILNNETKAYYLELERALYFSSKFKKPDTYEELI